jgi:hypothetical protein
MTSNKPLPKFILITNSCPHIYQYSIYKPLWILKVRHDFGEYYVATIKSMLMAYDYWYDDTTIAVRKEDCIALNSMNKDLIEKMNEHNNKSYGRFTI